MITNTLKATSESHFSKDQIVQVLALDGGGLKGLYSAAVIDGFEKYIGHSITSHFDIIAGTSTGGLIALGLGIGKSGKNIVDFYTQNGPLIFPESSRKGRINAIRSMFRCKYSNDKLREVVQRLYSVMENNAVRHLTLGESQKRLLIPTIYAANSMPRILKTPHDKRYRSDWKLPMWAVALSTSAAPTFLPSFNHEDHTYLDGGLWANNPSLVGVVEAIQMGASIENIRVLNISTTSSRSDCMKTKSLFTNRERRMQRSGLVDWGRKLPPLIMEVNSYATSRMYLHQMLSQGNFALIDEQIDVGHAALDSIDYDEFQSRGASAAEQASDKLEAFFRHEASLYTPSDEAMVS